MMANEEGKKQPTKAAKEKWAKQQESFERENDHKIGTLREDYNTSAAPEER